MKTIKPFIFSVSILALILSVGCAKIYTGRGDYYYNNLAYADATSFYKKAIKINPDPVIEAKLADSYRKVGKPADGAAVCVGPPDTTRPACELLIVQNLMEKDEFGDAKIWLADYLELTPNDLVAQNRWVACDSAPTWKVDSGLVTIQELSGQINSAEGSNFSAAFFGEGIAFVSERRNDVWIGKAAWTGRNYLDIYQVDKSDDLNWGTPQLMKAKLNGKYYEGPMSFSSNQDTVWFTRSNLSNGMLLESTSSVNNLELYYSVKHDENWDKPVKFQYNNSEYSIGHPSLSHDGSMLFLVSDMPGGQGGTDLYVCSRLGQGKWSEPVNLGKTVNTPGNEMFPFYARNEILYFSSNGQPTLGGLDIFSTRKKGSAWEKPVNLRYPINTAFDDFSFIMNVKDSTGYISSNRDNVIGVDKIYGFKIKAQKRVIPPVVECAPLIQMMKGKVVSTQTKTPVPGARVELFDSSGKSVKRIFANDEGLFSFPLDSSNAYKISGMKEGYFFNSMAFSSAGSSVFITLELDSLVVGKAIVIRDIYYDFDKWNIRSDAKAPLDHLVEVMNENPRIHIELSSHTDSRGSNAYNKTLSQERAESAVEYLVSHGIPATRMNAKGYGEDKLMNQCKELVECSEEEHQVNRRTEFTVIRKD